MNPTGKFLAVVFSGWIAVAVSAAPSSVASDATALLAGLPPQRMLREAREIVIAAGSELSMPKHKSPEELANAQRLVAIAKDIVPKLRPLITPGLSVLDYPGLLARGEITWDESLKEYEQYLGVYLRDAEGSGPYDFKIRFDFTGRILTVKNVVWKS